MGQLGDVTITVLSGALVGLVVSLINVIVGYIHDSRRSAKRRRLHEEQLDQELRDNFRRVQDAFTSGWRWQESRSQPEHGSPIESLQSSAYTIPRDAGAFIDWPSDLRDAVSRVYDIVEVIHHLKRAGKAIIVRRNDRTAVLAVDDQEAVEQYPTEAVIPGAEDLLPLIDKARRKLAVRLDSQPGRKTKE